MRDLIKINLWTTTIKNQIIANNGSVQSISEIPENIREIYKTVWEISQKKMINLAVARGPYICQSQSLNLYLENPQFNKMSLMHFYAWKNGLKTGQYYFRSRPARDAIKFTVNVDMLLKAADGGNASQMLECLNAQGDKKKKTKPASLETANMQTEEEKIKGAAQGVPAAKTENAKKDDSDSSEVEFECQNCSS